MPPTSALMPEAGSNWNDARPGIATPPLTVPSSCSYDGVSRSFVCPSVSVTGLTVSRSFTLYDASDNPQTAFDRTTTAAARMTTSLAGTVASGGTTLAIEEQQDMKVSGLLTGVHTLNGSSLIHVNGTVATGATTTPIVSTVAITISNLAVPRESTGPNRFPASGTVTALTEATYGALPKMTVGTTITFNGTSRAAVTVNVNGLTTHCTVDLSSATVALCTT